MNLIRTRAFVRYSQGFDDACIISLYRFTQDLPLKLYIVTVMFSVTATGLLGFELEFTKDNN